ncbi:PAS domain-containing protein [Hydrogenophaga sp. YM1]|uniref:sensor histidine kinase n=1 Tax=Hydrogenophaga sp. YM1 TaxID=2806262 RepID=UPI001959EAED|nr:ATP-binding protein [Hydrogenophaga sp. YM1]QRR34147.1 PAS domain-containing protein [Hydrogenophaga sp. YM1]
MKIARTPEQEAERVARLHQLGILDTLPDAAFDAITELAAHVCEAPVALISLIDTDRQWFKSRLGLQATETARDFAFCAHAILAPDTVMEVPDAHEDERFRDNPLVLGEPRIRYYAGAPIVTADGFALGTVCVIDHEARRLSPRQLDALQQLALVVNRMFDHTRAVHTHFSCQARRWQHQQAVLQAMGAAGLDLKAFIDCDYRYRYVNGSYLAYWNLTEEALLAQTVPELLTPEVFASSLKPSLDAALDGEEQRFQTVINFPTQGPRHVEVTYIPALRDEQGRPTGVVARIHDIHELKTRQLQLESTVKLLEFRTLQQQQYIHVLSHDLKEPLNTIGNFIALIDEDERAAMTALGQKYLDNVIKGSNRMKRVIEDLRRFFEVENHTLDMESVELDLVARQTVQALHGLIARHRAVVHVEALPRVHGNASLLRICLENLVSNAIQFARPGEPAQVRVHADEAGHTLAVHVDDQGTGIDPVHHEAIFSPYARLNTRRVSEGAGLGLPICRRIAHMHGGDIRVRSAPGAGSRFSLLLPRPAATQGLAQ